MLYSVIDWYAADFLELEDEDMEEVTMLESVKVRCFATSFLVLMLEDASSIVLFASTRAGDDVHYGVRHWLVLSRLPH